MWYTLQAVIDLTKDKITIDLFDVNIPKGETQNLIDAFNCERWYNKFDFKLY